jgi:single-strand DNA-binding protein
MNNISIAGNVTKDAELKFLGNGDPLASFSVADNQGKDKPAIFWNCSLFGKRAESLAPYLLRGNPVTVSGTVTEREWTDKDGNKRKSMDVRVSDIALQGGRKEFSESPPRQERPKVQAQRPASGFNVEDDTIPF